MCEVLHYGQRAATTSGAERSTGVEPPKDDPGGGRRIEEEQVAGAAEDSELRTRDEPRQRAGVGGRDELVPAAVDDQGGGLDAVQSRGGVVGSCGPSLMKSAADADA
jgi:hypothetical protein